VMPYASNTTGARNLGALRDNKWGILMVAGVHQKRPPWADIWAVDNGAWSAHLHGTPWDHAAFDACLDAHGAGAQFIVAPDIVAGGLESLRRTERWLPRLDGIGRRRLIAMQDGIGPDDVRALLSDEVGIFLGGSTDWKLATMRAWGSLARQVGCYFHVARVNTVRRIRLCQDVGADSFDGTSASRWSKNVPRLTAAVHQGHLWSTQP